MTGIRYTEQEGEALVKRMAEKSGRARSGLARAAALTPERRSEIAQDAAKASWSAPRSPKQVSLIEERMAQQIAQAGLPIPVREYFHIKDRDHRLDFAWPDLKIGVEVQGMAHRIKGRFRADIEKRALGLLAGWRILEVGGIEVRSGIAIRWLQALITSNVSCEASEGAA